MRYDLKDEVQHCDGTLGKIVGIMYDSDREEALYNILWADYMMTNEPAKAIRLLNGSKMNEQKQWDEEWYGNLILTQYKAEDGYHTVRVTYQPTDGGDSYEETVADSRDEAINEGILIARRLRPGW